MIVSVPDLSGKVLLGSWQRYNYNVRLHSHSPLSLVPVRHGANRPGTVLQ